MSSVIFITLTLLILLSVSSLRHHQHRTDLSYSTLSHHQVPASAAAKNISDIQWNILLDGLERWHGLWVRLDAHGRIVQSTRHQRYFEQISNYQVLQSNYVSYAPFSILGTHHTYYLYEKRYPLIDNFYAINNAEELKKMYKFNGVFLLFYPNCTIWGTLQIADNLPYVSHEKFIIHYNKHFRISVAPVYKYNSFQYITYAREVSEHSHYGSDLFTCSFHSTPYLNDYQYISLLNGSWIGYEQCITNDYILSHQVKTSQFPGILFENVHQDRILLELPDNIQVSVPRTVSLTNQTTQFMFRWIVNHQFVMFSETTYDSTGQFDRDCTIEYYRQ